MEEIVLSKSRIKLVLYIVICGICSLVSMMFAFIFTQEFLNTYIGFLFGFVASIVYYLISDNIVNFLVRK
jgi:zinc transporter ZupT